MRLLLAVLFCCSAAHAETTDLPPIVAIVGTVEDTHLTQEKPSREVGPWYTGTLSIRVESLMPRFSAPAGLKSGAVITVRVEEHNRRPEWKGTAPYIFLLEPSAQEPWKFLAGLPAKKSPKSTNDLAECIDCEDLARDTRGCLIVLNSVSLLELATTREEMSAPGMLDGGTIHGTVTLLIALDRQGKLQCAYVLQGHPLAFSSALEAIRRWEFLPFSMNGEAKAVVGVITLKYDFRTAR